MSNLEVNIQKTLEAKDLEKRLNIKWDLIQQFPYDAGFDLRACIPSPLRLLPTGHTTVPTGLHFELGNPNWEIQIRPRSGLAAKYGITVLNSPGTVDFGYRKEVKIILYNCDVYNDFLISPGDRIAQACFREIPEIKFTYVDQISQVINVKQQQKKAVSLAEEMKNKLLQKRGGFGSTGAQ
jgi:dUTP pyrophosphatase